MVAPIPRDERVEEVFASAAQLDSGVPAGLTDLLGAVLASRPAWMRDALCAEHPEVSFFPEKGGDVQPAKRVCSACLVKPECRTWALEQGPALQGVWAGTTGRERRQMRAALNQEPTPAGSVTVRVDQAHDVDPISLAAGGRSTAA